MGEGENPCQLLEELSDAGEAWEDWYQKYYAQVASREILFSSSFFGGRVTFCNVVHFRCRSLVLLVITQCTLLQPWGL